MMVAWAALILWPFLAVIFFAAMSVPAALVATIVGGYLFLPEQVEFDLPVLPPLDKHTIPALSALVLTAVAAKVPGTFQKGYIPRRPMVILLLAALFLGVMATVLTNGDPIQFQERWQPVTILPGLRTWDLMASGLIMVMSLIPFLLGRKYLATAEAQLQALKVFALLGFVYTAFALIEIRLSPQLNSWIYGFFPHSFAQHIRGGGFRPLVFLNHGLWLAIFFAMAIVAAAGLARHLSDWNQKAVFLFAAFWIFATLLLSRSLGAFLIALIFLGLMTQPQRVLHIGLLCLVGVVICYPLLRSFGLVPTELIVDLAGRVSADRAKSLDFRLTNEQIILNHALERPLFGWGGWGRNLAEIMENGKRVVPDGRWTISFGQGGYVRFLSEFGLLSIGVLGVVFSKRPVPFVSTIVAMILTANLFDLLPNGTLTSLTWLWAGALVGRLELSGEDATVPQTQTVGAASFNIRHPAGAVYSRDLGVRPAYRRQFDQTDVSQ